MPSDSASPDTPSASKPSVLLDPIESLIAWFSRHPDVAIAVGAFCLSVSATVIIRMWFLYRRAHFLKKVFWSVLLLIPFIGWFLYAGLFQNLDYNKEQGTTENFRAMGGDSWM